MFKIKNNINITFYSVIATILVFITICAAWFWLYARGERILVLPDPVDGISDASDINFDEEIGRISREMDFYPYKLYTTEDFKQGNVEEAQNRSDIHEAYKIDYATFRVTTKLLPNTYYSLAGYSMDYATRVYANGYEIVNVGNVSSNPEEAVPNVNYMHFTVLTGDDGILELILQYSNFVHREGGYEPFIYISNQDNINRFILDKGLPTYVLSGGLLVIAAYFFLDGVLRKKRLTLQLAFCCLLFSFRDQWFYIVSLIPYDYNWYIHYRIILAVLVLTPLAVLTLIESAFPNIIHKTITLSYSAVVMICAIMLFFIPTTEVAVLTIIINWAAIPYTLLLIYSIIRVYIKKKDFTLKDAALLTGIAILIISATLDLFFSDSLPSVTRGGIAPIGTLLFVIMFMSVVAMQAGEDKLKLEKSMRDKVVLEQINSVKSDFLMKMAHEIKTPLTVMSGYAQLTNIQIKYDEVNQETVENLKVISSEALRLSELVATLLEMPTGDTTDVKLERISVNDYLKYCSVICKGVLEKNNNKLVIKGVTGAHILGNIEMLIQMMLNLVINSNKHMTNGEFVIEAVNKNNGDTLSFIVSDTGVGIDPEKQMYIFDKHFTNDGSKGLGLSICKDIAHHHGADIQLIKSVINQGTTFEIKNFRIIKN